MAEKDTDIKIGGRFWSTTVDGKIIDASQIEVASSSIEGSQIGNHIKGKVEELQANLQNGSIKVKQAEQAEQDAKGNPIDSTYVTKIELEEALVGKTDYLGTIASIEALSNEVSTKCGKGDFYRVETRFDFNSDVAHVGDILIAKLDNPTSKDDWDLIHNEVDTDTWTANTKTAAGYVAKGENQVNKVWGTDSDGNPGWCNTTSYVNLENGSGPKSIKQVDRGGEKGNTFTFVRDGVCNNPVTEILVNNGKVTKFWNEDGKVIHDSKGVHASAFGGISRAQGDRSHSEGSATIALGIAAHVEGSNNVACTSNTHAEGSQTIAYGDASHAEGSGTISYGTTSHAEGVNTIAAGIGSHAEGFGGHSLSDRLNSDGIVAGKFGALGDYSHTEGFETLVKTDGVGGHAEGTNTTVEGISGHAEGEWTIATGQSSHAEGIGSRAREAGAHAEGCETTAKGKYSHAEGIGIDSDKNYYSALGKASHTEGYCTSTSSDAPYSHAEGNKTKASNEGAHAEGINTVAMGEGAHAEGFGTEGHLDTATGILEYSKAKGNYSHVEGCGTSAIGEGSHAEGLGIDRSNGNILFQAKGNYSHVEGYCTSTTSNAHYSHTEGYKTSASKQGAHAEGYKSQANGLYSHAGGYATVAGQEAQTVIGTYNKNNSNTLFEIGNGNGVKNDPNERSNAFEVLKDGRAKIYKSPIDNEDVVDNITLNNQIAEAKGEVTILTLDTSKGGNTITFAAFPGATKVDWGDGTVDIKTSHEYSATGIYKCKIYGLTSVQFCDPPVGITNNPSITECIIGNSVKSIGMHAFNSCLNLKSVVIPNSVTEITIGSYAFYSCSSLTNVVIPDSVTTIGNNAFRECSSLTSVEIGDSVTSIGSSAFDSCSSLTNITIPDSVTSIGGGVFSGCSGLTEITLPFIGAEAGVTSSDTYQYPFGYIFGRGSYTGGTATTQFYYGSSTSSATSSTYYIPTSLQKATITGGKILYGAFYNCSNLTSVVIPNSVTTIGIYAFYGCNSLTSVEIPDSVTTIGNYAFYECSNLTSIIIPNSVTSIGVGAFRDCSSLTNVTIGDSVESIYDYAFYSCDGLTSVIIPDSVITIGNGAFKNTIGLKEVVIKGNLNALGQDAFDGIDIINFDLKIIVPQQYIENYKSKFSQYSDYFYFYSLSNNGSGLYLHEYDIDGITGSGVGVKFDDFYVKQIKIVSTEKSVSIASFDKKKAISVQVMGNPFIHAVESIIVPITNYTDYGIGFTYHYNGSSIYQEITFGNLYDTNVVTITEKTTKLS